MGMSRHHTAEQGDGYSKWTMTLKNTTTKEAEGQQSQFFGLWILILL